ncbi:Peptide methionine sulfoxide reductase B5 [Porphyridium purpureum]|uniref:Peptide-methionine (R)-S-oxide reductase n=1 Tax=Porphyridium purpureum TaxID=35688 RepID=A0A5J4Z4K3_PORPP|nr:Peptide methionine sulfoxide reductase B5 [Porphyridium purpureum]|eukprot:POR7109..scf295_1
MIQIEQRNRGGESMQTAFASSCAGVRLACLRQGAHSVRVVPLGRAQRVTTRLAARTAVTLVGSRGFVRARPGMKNLKQLFMNQSSTSSAGDSALPAMLPKDVKDMTEQDWKSVLTKQEYAVLREKGTERPGTGEYNKFYPTEGHYVCAACSAPLYSAQAKFDSGCGWPAYDKCYVGAVKTEVDTSMGMRRVEIMCNTCGGHLGHVFENEGFTKTNERHCVNSVSVKYVKAKPEGDLAESKVV